MRQLSQPLYTIESFINNLVGDKVTLEVLEAQEGGEIYMMWDGTYINFSTDKKFIEGLGTDRIHCARSSPGVFQIDLDARAYWYMTFNFSDGGLVKNRIYRVSDYIC